jgi:protein-S-isoprenylcysteine O-methyltransferase Ste14
MRVYDLVVSGCWVLFLGVWAILSIVRGSVGKDERPYTPVARGVRLALLAVMVLAIFFGRSVPVAPFALAATRAAAATGAAAAGSVLCVVGLGFAMWARLTLGRHWGMPMTLRERPELVTAGPYAYVRHPIYTGVAALLLGTTLVYPIGILWCAVMIPYLVFSARREERDMERLFPDAYAAYKQRSKMLVPFVF